MAFRAIELDEPSWCRCRKGLQLEGELAVLVVHDGLQGRRRGPLREAECCDEVGGCGVSGFGGAADGVEGVADGGDPEAVAARVEGGQGGPGGGGGGQVIGLDSVGDVVTPSPPTTMSRPSTMVAPAPLTGFGMGFMMFQLSASGS